MWLNQAQNRLFSAQNECSAVSAALWVDRRRARAGSRAVGTSPCSSSPSAGLISELPEGPLQEGHPSARARQQLSVQGVEEKQPDHPPCP